LAVLPFEGTHPILYGPWPIPIGSSLRTAYIARPDAAGRFPVTLVLPTLDGLSGFEKDLCRTLARSGVAAIALDFYRRKGDPLEAYHELPDWRAMTDLDEVQEYVASDDVTWAVTDQLGILGLDIGGRFGIVAAATRPWVRAIAVVSTPLTGDEEREFQVAEFLEHLPIPVLGLYGATDDLIDTATVDEAQRRNDHGQWILYEGAGHDFLDVDAGPYHADAAADAVARIIEFFKTSLPPAVELDLG
jgi:carboxymethylenebutenolidase